MELGDQLLQYLLSGLSTGAIYALIGIGFSIIYNATGIINFAQGEFVMAGGMLTMFLISALKLPLWAAVPLAVLLATLAVCCSSGLPSGRLKNHLPSLWLSSPLAAQFLSAVWPCCSGAKIPTLLLHFPVRSRS